MPPRHARPLARPLALALAVTAASLLSFREAHQPGAQPAAKPDAQRDKRGPGLLERMEAFRTDVPAHPFDIVLVRPTPTSITASVVASADSRGFIELRREGAPPVRTPAADLAAGSPALFELTDLTPDTPYEYTLHLGPRDQAAGAMEPRGPYRFRTPRRPGSPFTFTIQADSHLDANMTPAVYEKMLAGALADAPDFHIDLGDTFMTDKRRDFHDAAPQYEAQRYYFGLLCHSAPLFMVLGNHDGENGASARGENAMAPWSYQRRTSLFPPPAPELPAQAAMYTGRTALEAGRGSNYYSFAWGDARIIVLDPFWPTTTKPRGGPESELTDNSWGMTLGREQYDWLAKTLETSTSRFCFVFTHHLVGGRGRTARGGAESSPYFEWGGKNADGSPGFAAHRPGWPMPIHDLLVKHHVAAVFHGHDHLYVHAQRDGLTYQCVPQPGNPRGGTRSAAEYGYTSGTILPSPGWLRVRISPDVARVDYLRSAPEDRSGAGKVGDLVRSYDLRP